METLNRQETEDLIVDLYYNQKKTFREVQKIVRKSPRDIRAILNRVDPGRSSLSISSQAYKLFSEGKTPLQVAITLNLGEPKAREFYLDYWNLQQLYSLNRIYQEIKGNLGFFVNLYRAAVSAGFNVQHVIRLLSIANNDLPAVEHMCQTLKREEAFLRANNQNAAKTLRNLNDQISDANKTLSQLHLFYNQKRQDINKILLQKTGLMKLVECFKKNNDTYLKFKETVKQEIKFTLTDPRQLLGIALISIIESAREDPRKFYALCYNKDITATTTTIQAPLTIGHDGHNDNASSVSEQSLHPDYSNSDKNYENMLIDESERIYNKLTGYIISKNINYALGKNVLLYQPETQLSNIEKGSSQKFSTCTYSREEKQTYISSEIENEKDQYD